ncbi:uncharacterized protein LOC110198817 [Phascolarctos cinereus]
MPHLVHDAGTRGELGWRSARARPSPCRGPRTAAGEAQAAAGPEGCCSAGGRWPFKESASQLGSRVGSRGETKRNPEVTAAVPVAAPRGGRPVGTTTLRRGTPFTAQCGLRKSWEGQHQEIDGW